MKVFLRAQKTDPAKILTVVISTAEKPVMVLLSSSIVTPVAGEEAHMRALELAVVTAEVIMLCAIVKYPPVRVYEDKVRQFAVAVGILL